MGRSVLLVAVIVGVMLAGAQAKPTDGEAVGRLCLEGLGFVVTTFLFYVAFKDISLPHFFARWPRMIERASGNPVA